ncbi:MAG: polysaccharide biosynthesis/export family protein [Syntrophobacteraceae bacterium]
MRFRTLLLLVLSFAMYCCGPFSENAKFVGTPGTEAPPIDDEYKIRVGDRLSIKLFYNPDLNQDVIVRPDGKVSLMLVRDIQAAARTPIELTDELHGIYGKVLQQPDVVVIVNSFAGHKVFVGGEVMQPGVKEIAGPTTVIQAITLAQWFKETARLNEVIVIRRGPDFKPYLIALDVEKAMKGIDIKQDVFVQPYDIIIVPRSNIADLNLWLNQYVRNSLPKEFAYYINLEEALRKGTIGQSFILQ